ncbi:hypothetical protein MOQ_003334 [Trypanosoma cruzi marinkellei]|uniref:Nuclear cap binding complex subunit CBP110 n=1 Tax=Trypanosoma cruzi marinkellei TaxID=85056 RepID=K2N0B4_TRYCR|nr:hypothetical protein MOQ_003334 [Trypanosoma cruzi marinkellei]
MTVPEINEENVRERGGEVPFSFLFSTLQSGAAAAESAQKTSDQWLWYFYLTAWSRPFFPHMLPPRPLCMGKGNNKNSKRKGKSGDVGLSFEESLALVGFPAADLVAAYDAQWHLQSQTSEAAELRAKSLTRVGSDCMYPPLPRVVESSFGRVFRALAVHEYLSAPSLSSSLLTSSSSSVEKLVQKALGITRQNHQQDAEENAGKIVTEEKAIESALQEMFSPDAKTSQYPLLFTLEGTTSTDGSDVGTRNKMEAEEKEFIKEAYRGRLFAALTVEVFFRVKKLCACMLLAFVGASGGKVARARACGVVVGIVEYAIAYRCYREDGTGRCPLTAAALLLCSLVEVQDTVTRERLTEDGKEENEEEEGLSGGLIATIIVASLQELLFAAVVGGPVAPHRLPPGVAPGAPKSLKKTSAKSKQQQQEPFFELTVRPVVLRALALHEVDALLQVLLPVLLQQVGFEWPWSESLRRARLLEKIPQESVTILEGVRLNSQAVFDELLAAVGRRTYVSRFQNILPQSYESLFVAAFPTEVEDDGGAHSDGDGKGNENAQRPLFIMPKYYKAAGEALIEFFATSGLSGTTVRETERVLIRNTDVQPMIVQLQALGRRADDMDDSDDHNHLTEDRNLLSTVRLSDSEKQKLLLRYRCEVLLASIVVYTQLQTLSLVQQLVRQLAPLIEKLLLPLMQERTLRRPFVVRRKKHSLGDDDTSEEGNIEFTPEFKVLMDDIHYEFYPLEWIPEVLNAQLKGDSSELDASKLAFYSVFAAVAYQFGIVLHGGPQGLRGGDDTDYKDRVKAYRFFHVLLLNSLVDAVTSSCELEGAMALAATRRVGGAHRQNYGNDILNDESSQALLGQCGAASFHAVVNPADVIFALAQCLLPPKLILSPKTAMVGLEDENQRPCEGWLRRVIEWTQSTRTRWAMQRQTVVGSTVPLAFLPNSLTFDAVPLAREVIRGIRRRLVEKVHVKKVVSTTGQCTLSDPLLQQHLLSLQSLLEIIALLPQHSSENNAKMFSAAELLWYSPLFSRELQLSGHFLT